MRELDLRIIKTKHKKIEGFLKEKKDRQKEKNKIAGIERHRRAREHKKNNYKNYSWWADFSSDVYYKNYSTSLSGLFGQYSVITNGKTKNEH